MINYSNIYNVIYLGEQDKTMNKTLIFVNKIFYLLFLGRNFGHNIICDLDPKLLIKDLVLSIEPFEKMGGYFQKIREKLEEFHMESLGDTIRIEQNTRLADFMAA